MRRTRRPLAALGLVAMVALISASCGTNSTGSTTGANHQETGAGSSGDNENAAATPAGTGGSRGNKHASTHAKAVKFAECMRANGVSAFPDPAASGSLTIDEVANGSSLDTSSTAFDHAISACKDLEPAGFTGHKASAKQQVARLEFAQCMRDNGVKDFPDPAKDAPLIDTRRIPSSERPGGMGNLNAAMKKCSSYSDKAGVRVNP